MKIGIIPCQGTCNVGNMTHKIALKLYDGKSVDTVCSLGLPLGLPSIIATAKTNDQFIALNGCKLRCASLALKSIGINGYDEIVLTEDFKIPKNKNFTDETKINEVEIMVREKIAAMSDKR